MSKSKLLISSPTCSSLCLPHLRKWQPSSAQLLRPENWEASLNPATSPPTSIPCQTCQFYLQNNLNPLSSVPAATAVSHHHGLSLTTVPASLCQKNGLKCKMNQIPLFCLNSSSPNSFLLLPEQDWHPFSGSEVLVTWYYFTSFPLSRSSLCICVFAHAVPFAWKLFPAVLHSDSPFLSSRYGLVSHFLHHGPQLGFHCTVPSESLVCLLYRNLL